MTTTKKKKRPSSRGPSSIERELEQVARDEADAAKNDAAKNGPTARDKRIADDWYPHFRNGTMTEHDLAQLLTSVRFDAELVRVLERDLLAATMGVRSSTRATPAASSAAVERLRGKALGRQ